MYYFGICKERCNIVKKEYCFGYALDRILNNEGEKKEFIEWFYSGNWIKIDKGDEDYE